MGQKKKWAGKEPKKPQDYTRDEVLIMSSSAQMIVLQVAHDSVFDKIREADKTRLGTAFHDLRIRSLTSGGIGTIAQTIGKAGAVTNAELTWLAKVAAYGRMVANSCLERGLDDASVLPDTTKNP